jgi:hypothetical protein
MFSAVAEDAAILDDDVAQVDPEPERQAPSAPSFVLGAERALDLDRAAHRGDRARELRQQIVAGGIDDSSPNVLTSRSICR